jgi:pimeloyl-ACP methyl ester carboxylesterase
MKEVYLISGLGADRRVFKHLGLGGHHVHYIDWIEFNLNDTLTSYSTRLLNQITTSNPVLVGVSFGGMIAVEMAKQIETDKVILISSAKTRREIPVYLRAAATLKVIHVLPVSWLKQVSALTYWAFGIKTEDERRLLKTIIKETDPQFLRSALILIGRWDNVTLPKNLFSVHGSSDHILPMHTPDFVIKGGGHFMILNRAGEISSIVNEILTN